MDRGRAPNGIGHLMILQWDKIKENIMHDIVKHNLTTDSNSRLSYHIWKAIVAK